MQRQLVTILAADIAGFSRLVGAAEEATLARQRSIREDIITPFLEKFGGRVANTAGDSLLIAFPSAVEAVRCALKIQNAISVLNADIPQDRRIEYRMGINIGDVVKEGDDLLGDGVNIAARLEGLADPGGLCIARAVFDNVGGKVDGTFEDMGKQTLKNIAEPVRVFRLLTVDASIEKLVGQGVRSAKPSIAVLPIDNISANPDLDSFAAGLSEDMVAALTRVSDISVMPLRSPHSGARKGSDTQKLAGNFGVSNVLEGRVQSSKNRLRVTLQLVDSANGNFIWAERFDRDADNFFDLQDEIVHKTLIGIRTKLVDGDLARIVGSGTQHLTAWLSCSEAFDEWAKFSRDSNFRARELFLKAMEADPVWSRPLSGMAAACRESAIRGWGNSRERDLEEGVSFAERAIEVNSGDQAAWSILGMLQIDRGLIDQGIASCERAIEIAPSDFVSLANLAFSLPRLSEFTRSLALFARSRKVRPLPSGAVLANEGFVAHLAGEHEMAIKLLKQSSEWTEILDPLIRLAAIYADQGHMEKARSEISDALSRQPDATIEEFTKLLPFPNRRRREWYNSLLNDAGLPASS